MISTARLVTIINSCVTVEQLETTLNYVKLAENDEMDLQRGLPLVEAFRHLVKTEAKYKDIYRYGLARVKKVRKET